MAVEAFALEGDEERSLADRPRIRFGLAKGPVRYVIYEAAACGLYHFIQCESCHFLSPL